MLNLIQDVGWMHAFHLNLKLDPNQGWVFTRQKLLLSEWPVWNETVTIRTWLRPPARAFTFRDYEISIGDRMIGEATASFLVIDLKTRKPVQVKWSQTEDFWRKEGVLSLEPEKILVEGEGAETARFAVRNSDLDMNDHVNNTKYAQWVLDSLPVDTLRKGINLHGYEVNFLTEAKLGDEIIIRRFGPHSSKNSLDTTFFQGVRESDGKTVFTSRLLSSEGTAR